MRISDTIFYLVPKLIATAKTQTFYRLLFQFMGEYSTIYKPVFISNPDSIRIGRFVTIRAGSRLEAIVRAGEVTPLINIGNSVTIEQNLHLSCAQEVVIEDGVTISSGVGIWDVSHSYEDIHTPILKQPLKTSPVRIGSGSLIGTGCVILPGTNIGKQCMIGANSVVNGTIPDYSVAVGAPARVVRRYDVASATWIKISSKE